MPDNGLVNVNVIVVRVLLDISLVTEPERALLSYHPPFPLLFSRYFLGTILSVMRGGGAATPHFHNFFPASFSVRKGGGG